MQMRLKYNFCFSRLAKIQKFNISGYIGWWEIDLLMCSWTVKWYYFYEMKFGNIYQNKKLHLPFDPEISVLGISLTPLSWFS